MLQMKYYHIQYNNSCILADCNEINLKFNKNKEWKLKKNTLILKNTLSND